MKRNCFRKPRKNMVDDYSFFPLSFVVDVCCFTHGFLCPTPHSSPSTTTLRERDSSDAPVYPNSYRTFPVMRVAVHFVFLSSRFLRASEQVVSTVHRTSIGPWGSASSLMQHCRTLSSNNGSTCLSFDSKTVEIMALILRDESPGRFQYLRLLTSECRVAGLFS